MDCSGVAILTSGGDAPGMNAAVRAVIRYLAHERVPVFSILEGYSGLCSDNIVPTKWFDVMGILSRGGTKIGTARCMEFKERAGRKEAARNLIRRRINSLIVIGGDGSLTGASIFRTEWPGYVKELQDEKLVKEEDAKYCAHLNIVGMVGSIDNDLCGTDMTIGTDSALHRIVDAIDCLASTAASHMRTFIIEVMGRHCGYLALISALAAPCDWVFVPESPPEPGWEGALMAQMKSSSSKRFKLVIIAEGAVDREGNAIKADYVKKVLSDGGMDVRVTVLGHVQRGGQPTAFDRILGSRLGCEAAKCALEGLNKDMPPCFISLNNNEIIRLPLMEAIERTLSVKMHFQNKDWEKAQELRGSRFGKKLTICKMLSVSEIQPHETNRKIGVLCIGAPAPGMNSGIRALVKIAAFHGDTVRVFYEGVNGLISDDSSILTPAQCEIWGMIGGCSIGASRKTITEENLPIVMERLKSLDALVIFGGFEAIFSCLVLCKATPLPIYIIPATISNNVPGSDFSLGCDTALNSIVRAVDSIKQSAASTRKRVFVIELMGGNCGYLTVMSGIACGADAVYIPEEPVGIDQLQADVSRVIDKMERGVHRGIIMRNEASSPHYKNDFVTALYAEEGAGKFVVRSNILGHIQQGYSPSPFDRCVAAQFASKVYRDLEKCLEKDSYGPEDVVVVGVIGSNTCFTPVTQLEMDAKRRVPGHTSLSWLQLKPLIPILSLPPPAEDKEMKD